MRLIDGYGRRLAGSADWQTASDASWILATITPTNGKLVGCRKIAGTKHFIFKVGAGYVAQTALKGVTNDQYR